MPYRAVASAFRIKTVRQSKEKKLTRYAFGDVAAGTAMTEYYDQLLNEHKQAQPRIPDMPIGVVYGLDPRELLERYINLALIVGEGHDKAMVRAINHRSEGFLLQNRARMVTVPLHWKITGACIWLSRTEHAAGIWYLTGDGPVILSEPKHQFLPGSVRDPELLPYEVSGREIAMVPILRRHPAGQLHAWEVWSDFPLIRR